MNPTKAKFEKWWQEEWAEHFCEDDAVSDPKFIARQAWNAAKADSVGDNFDWNKEIGGAVTTDPWNGNQTEGCVSCGKREGHEKWCVKWRPVMSDDKKAVKAVHYDAICRHYKEPEEWSVVDSGTGESYGWSDESEASAWADARSLIPVAQPIRPMFSERFMREVATEGIEPIAVGGLAAGDEAVLGVEVEMPPLDIAESELEFADRIAVAEGANGTDPWRFSYAKQTANLLCRERQLLAALKRNAELATGEVESKDWIPLSYARQEFQALEQRNAELMRLLEGYRNSHQKAVQLLTFESAVCVCPLCQQFDAMKE